MATASTNPLQVALPCDCGRSVSASTKDAGGSIVCNCGRSVAVPSLSQLRPLAGRDAYVTNPVNAIEKAMRNGTSPAGENCVMCGTSNPVIYMCHAACESTYAKGGSGRESNDLGRLFWMLALFIMSKLLFFIIWWTKKQTTDEVEIRGHEVGVSFPLPVCDSCSKSAGDVTRPKVAKQMMTKVPMYQALLEHYPQPELSVERRSQA